MPLGSSPVRRAAASAARRGTTSRAQRLTATRSVRQAVVSLAGLIGEPVRNQAGEQVGRLVDVVARLYGEDRYPPVTGLVVRVGRRRAFLDASAIAQVNHRWISLRSARMDLRDYVRRPGEVLLARDLLDHQLVDVDGVQVIRAADVYVAPVGEQVHVVGVDVSVQTLLRRLGPKRFRGRPTPDRVIDWDAIAPFGEEATDGPATVRLRRSQQALRRLRPGELADLLEDLGRAGRQELLASLEPETAADALEEMEPDELEGLLRESEPQQAADLVAAMEPDEAVDALRDLSAAESDELLELMPGPTRERLSGLMGYPEDEAGGFMTTLLIRAEPEDTVSAVRARVADHEEHRGEIDAVVVCDADGQVIGDLSLFELLVAPPDLTVRALLDQARTDPVLVGPDADVNQVAVALVESRRSSLLVVDDGCRPLGRILADDVLDALTPEAGRLRFPRLLR